MGANKHPVGVVAVAITTANNEVPEQFNTRGLQTAQTPPPDQKRSSIDNDGSHLSHAFWGANVARN